MIERKNSYNKYNIDKEKIYNLKDILDNFTNYYGISFNNLKNLFAKYEIISLEIVENYILGNKNRMYETKFENEIDAKKIFEKRVIDYKYFKKTLKILSNKGLKYLELLEYIGNMECDLERISQKEELLNELDIFHYGSILKGNDILKLLKKLNNVINSFNNTLHKINSLETYNNQTIDKFALIFGKNDLYPEESLVVTDDYINDNTSFYVANKKYARKKINIQY